MRVTELDLEKLILEVFSAVYPASLSTLGLIMKKLQTNENIFVSIFSKIYKTKVFDFLSLNNFCWKFYYASGLQQN